MFGENKGEQLNSEPEEIRERVDGLRETDNGYEDSVHDLAKNEDEIREEMKKAGVGKKDADKLADVFSTKDLEKMEAEKAKWIDDLTGLRNKNAYQQEVPQLLSIEKRQGKDCSMLVVDFDYFKKVNDEFGHDAGDEVLKQMAATIKKVVRSSDTVYRFGGEEFVVFLPGTVSENAADVAEKIRAEVEKMKIKITSAKVKLNKTVSIGCVGTDQLANWQEYKSTDSEGFLKKMFKAADLSVGASKENGRNQVTLFSEDLKETK